MSEHKAIVRWSRSGPDFLKGQYSREHTWNFDGGVSVPASSALSSVPAPWSNSACVDPEEAFVAAVSSCHMLTFLYLASKRGFQADSYCDEAAGRMSSGPNGVPWVASITLRPRVVWSGLRQPNFAEEDKLHELAHEECFIANSIKSEIRVEHPGRRPI